MLGGLFYKQNQFSEALETGVGKKSFFHRSRHGCVDKSLVSVCDKWWSNKFISLSNNVYNS